MNASGSGGAAERSGWWWLPPLLALIPLFLALWWWQEARELRSTQEAELAARRLLAQRVEALARTRAELADRLARDPRPIRAKSPTLAVAELQSAFASVTEHAGVTVETTQILAAEPHGGFHRLRLRATVTTDHAGLRDWLFTLERARPLLAVDSLAIRARAGEEDRLIADIMVSNPAMLQLPAGAEDSGEETNDRKDERRRTP